MAPIAATNQSDDQAGLPYAAADRLSIGVVVADLEGRATYANRTWRTLTGQPGDTPLGTGWWSTLRCDRPVADWPQVLATVPPDGVIEAECSALLPSGARRPLRVTVAQAVDDDGHAQVVVSIADATPEHERTAVLVHQATHDPLTGLYNRAQLLEFLRHSLEGRARTPDLIAAVLFIDVDDLKGTNDRHGHHAGDQLLVSVAHRITAAVRPGDVVARYGGDEFVVLCEGLHDLDEATAVAARIQRAVGEAGDDHRSCTVSIGVAEADPVLEPPQIVRNADRAMYEAKESRSDVASTHAPRPGGLPWPDAAPVPGSGGHLALLAAAAHELRTPLTAITGLAATLRRARDRLAPEDLDAAFVAIDTQSGRLSRMLTELLELGSWASGAHPLQLAPVRMGDAISEALAIAPPPDDVSVTVSPIGDPGSAGVSCDRDGLVQAIASLLTNAYRHGGPAVAVTVFERAGAVQLLVEDDGPGVPADLAESLFDPFSRGAASRARAPDSTGLGLALARAIVAAHGGTLVHDDVAPTGARFTVTLPASAVDRIAPTPTAAEVEPPEARAQAR